VEQPAWQNKQAQLATEQRSLATTDNQHNNSRG
jgi:hypothetical protein